uniref:Uncharacterized protein n=1 Tax=Anguilla anguilla TaxID=7936 RepID=A0A0E9QPK6_ANGAN
MGILDCGNGEELKTYWEGLHFLHQGNPLTYSRRNRLYRF